MNEDLKLKRELGEITLQNIERWIRKKGWKIIYYGCGGLGDEYLCDLGLKKYSEKLQSFAYRDNFDKMICVRHDAAANKKMFLLLHEIAHIELGHDLTDLTPADESEANAFARRVLEKKVSPIIIATLAIISGVIILVVLYIVSSQANTSTVLITPSGNRFHLASCSYVLGRTDTIEITRDEALKMGKSPCFVCKP